MEIIFLGQRNWDWGNNTGLAGQGMYSKFWCAVCLQLALKQVINLSALNFLLCEMELVMST